VAAIFEKHQLDIGELFRMRQASAGVHPLRDISVGMQYSITLDPNNTVLSLAYRIDDEGKSLRKAFLKAPLSYRRISSGFTKRRMHPILKIARPHLGVDYAAPAGTPVSTVGDGTVIFAGRKGPNGNLVIVRHPNGYTTSYGHLARIKKGIRRRAEVRQGDVIGTVGSTGLSTGPHLDYRIRRNGTFLNPLAVNLPRGGAIPGDRMSDFRGVRETFARSLSAISPAVFAGAEPSVTSAK
jgi:murein DD-endopeptidase MepM/ murein hydrolase activator NlpD